MTGTQSANRAAKEADVVIAVGTRLTDFTTSSKWLFGEHTKIVSVNICPFDAVKMDGEPIICDAREGLAALTKALKGYRAQNGEDAARERAEWLRIAV